MSVNAFILVQSKPSTHRSLFSLPPSQTSIFSSSSCLYLTRLDSKFQEHSGFHLLRCSTFYPVPRPSLGTELVLHKHLMEDGFPSVLNRWKARAVLGCGGGRAVDSKFQKSRVGGVAGESTGPLVQKVSEAPQLRVNEMFNVFFNFMCKLQVKFMGQREL